MITIKIQNAAEIKRSFKKYPIKTKSAIKTAIRKSALLVERESKVMTPVDTGRLRSSIMSDILPMKATVAPHTDYAIHVHEGTRRMKGRPFMEQGLRKAENRIQGFFKNEIKKALK